MKKLLLLTLLLISVGTAHATISVANVGNFSNISGNSGTVTAIDSASVGDVIEVTFYLLNQGSAATSVAVSDNLNGSYAQSGTQAVNAGFNSGGGGISISFWVRVTVSGTPNITITTTGFVGSFIAGSEARLTGFTGTPTLDASTSANAQGTGTSIVNAPGSTAHANEMSVAFSRTDTSGLSTPSGWFTSFGGPIQWQLYASSSSAVSFPATMSPSQGWLNDLVTIYDATATAPSPNFFLLQ